MCKHEQVCEHDQPVKPFERVKSDFLENLRTFKDRGLNPSISALVIPHSPLAEGKEQEENISRHGDSPPHDEHLLQQGVWHHGELVRVNATEI